MEFKHPNYYKKLRKQRRDSTEALPRNGESLVLVKSQAPSTKPQAPSAKLLKHQAASPKPRTTSFKLQAGSYKLSDS